MNEQLKRRLLLGILVIAALLRLFGLGRGDTMSDESSLAFRAVGMMDFDESPVQTTPLEWFDPSTSSGQVQPWWLRLSFHDQPPLLFLIQNGFMKVFGESVFGFRLPSVLLGIGAVYLLYVIGRKLFSERVGLYAAALYAITLNGVYISRTGMQEAYVIFFFLLSLYWFLKALENDKYFFWTGVAIGLGILSKYTAFIIVPILCTYLIFFRRDCFRNQKFWFGTLIAVLFFSPVLIYNWQLYKAVGYFDFQFSFIFGQHPEVWQVTPGKEIGSALDRIRNFPFRLIATNSWLFLSLFFASVLTFIFRFFKDAKIVLRKYALLLISFVWLIALILKIGPSYRFLTMLTPFMILGVGIFLAWLNTRARYATIFVIFLTLVFSFEIAYTWNNQIAYYPIGPQPWFSSKVRYENYNWGYNELNAWLEKELEGKMPAVVFNVKYKFLEAIRDQATQKAREQFRQPYPALFVYYGNFDQGPKLWILDRLHIYHGWPIISVKTYFEYLQQNGFDYYERVGFQYLYFINQTNIVSFPGMEQLTQREIATIANQRGDEVFKIYFSEL
ncbi:MAG TPA: glycosyltransferase family 39 protein [Candidatus Paceibacterota bacterium]